jgi:hypothetical protein
MDLVDEIRDYMTFFDRRSILRYESKNLELGISYFNDDLEGLVLGLADFKKRNPDYYEIIFQNNTYDIFKREGVDRNTDFFFSKYGNFVIDKISEYRKTRECGIIIKTIKGELC